MHSKKMFLLTVLFTFSIINNILSENIHHKILNHIEKKSSKEQFKLWHYIFNKPYELNSHIALSRYKIFKNNLKIINSHNSQSNNEYVLGIGPYTDLEWEEFNQIYLNNNMKENIINNNKKRKELEKYSYNHRLKSNNINKKSGDKNKLNISNIITHVTSIDNKNQKNLDNYYLSSTLLNNVNNNKENNEDSSFKDWSYLFNYVKDQGKCGCCWAFATISVIEAQALKNNINVRLSEQGLIDCDTENNGCNGGWYDSALTYAVEYGIAKEDTYKYKAEKHNKCLIDTTKNNSASDTEDNKLSNLITINPHIKVLDYVSCFYNEDDKDNEYQCTDDAITEDIIKEGPYATAIDADIHFMLYVSGVYNSSRCKDVNHAVTVVQVNKKDKYVKIRNSWGKLWGEDGYARISIETSKINKNIKACFTMNFAYQPRGIKVIENED